MTGAILLLAVAGCGGSDAGRTSDNEDGAAPSAVSITEVPPSNTSALGPQNATGHYDAQIGGRYAVVNTTTGETVIYFTVMDMARTTTCPTGISAPPGTTYVVVQMLIEGMNGLADYGPLQVDSLTFQVLGADGERDFTNELSSDCIPSAERFPPNGTFPGQVSAGKVALTMKDQPGGSVVFLPFMMQSGGWQYPLM